MVDQRACEAAPASAGREAPARQVVAPGQTPPSGGLCVPVLRERQTMVRVPDCVLAVVEAEEVHGLVADLPAAVGLLDFVFAGALGLEASR